MARAPQISHFNCSFLFRVPLVPWDPLSLRTGNQLGSLNSALSSSCEVPTGRVCAHPHRSHDSTKVPFSQARSRQDPKKKKRRVQLWIIMTENSLLFTNCNPFFATPQEKLKHHNKLRPTQHQTRIIALGELSPAVAQGDPAEQ